MPKRTYSQREKRQSACGYQSLHNSRKRPKIDDSDELHLPPSPPPSRGEKTSSLLKKSLKVFGGPISVPEHEMNVDSAPKGKNRHNVFDKVLNERIPVAKPKQCNIYGSRQDFAETMKNGRNWKQHDPMPGYSHLPTPPAEVPKVAHGEGHRAQRSPKARRIAVEHAPVAQNASVALTETSLLFEKVIKGERPKQLSKPKAHKDDNTLAPRKDLLGNYMSRKSKEVKIWSTNQASSPFLSLPGEIRNLIYEYALGGNTIIIDFETYRTIYKPNNPRQIVPIFKYRCFVFNKIVGNPFSWTQHIDVSTGFTLLNQICRQMYLESAVLPFKLNLMSFSSHNIMFNFLFMERRVTRSQLGAITQLALPDALPQPNMLTHLRNLKKVFLGIHRSNQSKGWYYVVRREGEEPTLVDFSYAH